MTTNRYCIILIFWDFFPGGCYTIVAAGEKNVFHFEPFGKRFEKILHGIDAACFGGLWLGGLLNFDSGIDAASYVDSACV